MKNRDWRKIMEDLEKISTKKLIENYEKIKEFIEYLDKLKDDIKD